HRVGDPDQGNQDVQGPLKLGVFLGAGKAQWQRDDCSHQYGLPAPERERRQLVAEQADLTGTLHHVVRRGEQGAGAKGENDPVRMQWAQTAIAQPWRVEIEFRPYQLRCDQYPDRHANHPPDYGGNRELPDNTIVEGFSLISESI